jgi:hypothetical protein
MFYLKSNIVGWANKCLLIGFRWLLFTLAIDIVDLQDEISLLEHHSCHLSSTAARLQRLLSAKSDLNY